MAEKGQPKQPPAKQPPGGDPKSLFVPLPSKKVTGSLDHGNGGSGTRRKGRG